jgi:hypothetical protein
MIKFLILNLVLFLAISNLVHASAARHRRQQEIQQQKQVQTEVDSSSREKSQELKNTAVALEESKNLYEQKLHQIEQKLRDAQSKLENSGATTPGTGTYTPVSEEQLRSIGGISGVDGLTEDQKRKVFAQILNFKLLNESKKKIEDLVLKINDRGYSDAAGLSGYGHAVLAEIEALSDAEAQNEPTIDILKALENTINDPSRHPDVRNVAGQLYLRVSNSISPETTKVFLSYVIEKTKMFSIKLGTSEHTDPQILSLYGEKIIKEIGSFKDEKGQEVLIIQMLEALENTRFDKTKSKGIIDVASRLFTIISESENSGIEKAYLKFLDIQKKNGMLAYLNDERIRQRHEATLNRVKGDPNLFPTAYIMLIDSSYFSIPVSPSATQDAFNNVDKVQKNLYSKLTPTFRYLDEDVLESIKYVVYQSYFIGGDAVKRDVANSYIDSINDALLQKKIARDNRNIHDKYVSDFMSMKRGKTELERVGADTTGILNEMEKLKAAIIAKRKELEKESQLEAKRDEHVLKAPYAEIVPLIEKREKGIPSIEHIKTTKGITDVAKAAKTAEEEAEARKQETFQLVATSGLSGRVNEMRKMKEGDASAGGAKSASSGGSAAGGMADLLKRAKEAKEEKDRKDAEKKKLKQAEEADKVRLRNLESQRKEAEAYERLSGGLEDDDLDRREKEKKAKSARPKMSFGGGAGGSLLNALAGKVKKIE